MSSIRWRVLQLEQQAQDSAQLTEQEAVRCLREVLQAAGNGMPAGDIVLPDLRGTKAGAFLEALGEAGRCVV